MDIKHPLFTCLLALILVVAQGGSRAADSAESRVKPCTLQAGSDEISLDFNGVIERYLYRYGLTPSRAFTLRLDKCKSHVLAAARLRLTGSASDELPGLLTLAGASTATGVVMGLQTADGQALPINGSETQRIAIEPGDRSIALQAYLEAEPSAQRSRNLVLERFSATNFVVLDYQ